MYIMLNSAMMIMGNRTLLLGVVFAIVFLLFIMVIAYGKAE
ncbi:MAG: hypothetical protein RL023_118 [Candidatus Parcubacteria bacterium]|jgi:hypothetical protein